MANSVLSVSLLLVTTLGYGCSSDTGETCDGQTPCDTNCDGVVDEVCSIAALIPATGGELRIDEGPLAGFSLVVPPGALAEDTEISLHVRPGESLQAVPGILGQTPYCSLTLGAHSQKSSRTGNRRSPGAQPSWWSGSLTRV